MGKGKNKHKKGSQGFALKEEADSILAATLARIGKNTCGRDAGVATSVLKQTEIVGSSTVFAMKIGTVVVVVVAASADFDDLIESMGHVVEGENDDEASEDA